MLGAADAPLDGRTSEPDADADALDIDGLDPLCISPHDYPALLERQIRQIDAICGLRLSHEMRMDNPGPSLRRWLQLDIRFMDHASHQIVSRHPPSTDRRTRKSGSGQRLAYR